MFEVHVSVLHPFIHIIVVCVIVSLTRGYDVIRPKSISVNCDSYSDPQLYWKSIWCWNKCSVHATWEADCGKPLSVPCLLFLHCTGRLQCNWLVENGQWRTICTLFVVFALHRKITMQFMVGSGQWKTFVSTLKGREARRLVKEHDTTCSKQHAA